MTKGSPITISVVTATWNCAKTLPDCLASLARQSYANREHVIVDGASTDGTVNVIKQNIDQIAAFKSERDKGIYDALNKGIQLTTGDVVGFLHADDFYASDDSLSKIANAFEDPNVCAVFGDLEYVNQKDTSKVIRRWQSKPFNSKDLSWGWMPAHPTLYVRREWYSRIGGFDTSYRIAADYLSILKLFSQPNFKTVYISDVLVTMRLGGASNKSVKAIVNKSKEDTSLRVMRILQANPDITQRELAQQVGISVGGLNYCLKALVEKGWVKMKNFAHSKNKFGYVYVLTPSGMAEKAALTGRFLQRKMA